MLAREMYDFRNTLREKGILFCYSGYMTEEVLSGIGNALRRKLELEKTDRKTAKSVFSIFVEQVQNVIRYSAEREPPGSVENKDDLRSGVLTVGWQNDRFFISCGNLVEQRDVERLETSLTYIQSLDKDALKTLYKETLRGEVPVGSKGAGVGFIDIATFPYRAF